MKLRATLLFFYLSACNMPDQKIERYMVGKQPVHGQEFTREFWMLYQDRAYFEE